MSDWLTDMLNARDAKARQAAAGTARSSLADRLAAVNREARDRIARAQTATADGLSREGLSALRERELTAARAWAADQHKALSAEAAKASATSAAKVSAAQAAPVWQAAVLPQLQAGTDLASIIRATDDPAILDAIQALGPSHLNAAAARTHGQGVNVGTMDRALNGSGGAAAALARRIDGRRAELGDQAARSRLDASAALAGTGTLLDALRATAEGRPSDPLGVSLAVAMERGEATGAVTE